MLFISNISLIRDKVSMPFLRPSAPLTGGEGGGGGVGGEAPVGRSGGGGVRRRLTFQTKTKLIIK